MNIVHNEYGNGNTNTHPRDAVMRSESFVQSFVQSFVFPFVAVCHLLFEAEYVTELRMHLSLHVYLHCISIRTGMAMVAFGHAIR